MQPLQTPIYMDNLNHFYPQQPMQMPQMVTQQPADAYLEQPPEPVVNLPPLTVIFSRIDCLLNHTHTYHTSLWTLAAFYWHPVLQLSKEQNLFPVCPLKHTNHTLHSLANTQYHTNPLFAKYDTCSYTPAFDIHPMQPVNHQTCNQHHSPLTNSTNPYNPAFDIHPTLNNHQQKCHQHHTRLSWAPPVQVFVQNKRPL